ncbi:Two-pore potassium channel 5 [Platanthera guangdongensis]|uniref:Two-pore potassium channel 5 n=1 Tax=Platanthera guangdongensis TaxID=2320717 RepID=A0ABR2LSI0_9ASPA
MKIKIYGCAQSPPPPPPPPALKYSVVLLFLYGLLIILIHALNPEGYSGFETHLNIDALYFHIVYFCTVGYGDIDSLYSLTKIMSCLLLSYAFDIKNEHIMIHANVGCTFIVFIVLVALGVVGIQFLEDLKFIDSLYLSIMLVTTMGYEDFSFKAVILLGEFLLAFDCYFIHS